jgi:nitroreductase
MDTERRKALEFILSRRSIRVFAPGDISDEEVQAVLEAAMAAPSAMGKDPWRFVVVRNRAMLDQIADRLANGRMLSNAVLGIFVCGDLDVAHDHQLSYMLQDCAGAVLNLLLAAHVIGLGGCWLGLHPREDRLACLRATFGLPPSVIPVAGVALGRPGEQKEARTRYRGDYVHHDGW